MKKKKTRIVAIAMILITASVLSSVTGVSAEENSDFNTNIETLPKIENVDINEQNFPDLAFRTYVLKRFDANSDQKLSSKEINEVTFIDIFQNLEIKSLQGIEFFPKLENLLCNESGITSLDISKNIYLRYLDCRGTGITGLDVSKNSSLQGLNCNNTEIKILDISNNIELTDLYCDNTKIETLDVSKNTKLTDLYCAFTGITSLDVSKNSEIRNLACYNTGITSLDVSKNSNLEGLNCSNTGITSLDVSKNIYLWSLNCYNTGITSLDVSKNSNLRSLNCYNTGITSLDVSKNTNLKDLNCNFTEITSLDVSKNSNLQFLQLSNTKIEILDVSKNNNLGSLDCSNTGITSLDLSENKFLRLFSASGVPLTYLNIGNNSKLVDINIQNPKTAKFKVTGNTFNLKEINDGMDFRKVTIKSGGKLNQSTGIISDYEIGSTIEYTYDCGSSKDGPVTLNVSLMPVKSDSSITINKDLSRGYDGNKTTLTNNDITVKGSTGAISYIWEMYNGSEWVKSDVPVNVGKYRVTVNVEEDDYYNEASPNTKEFIISKGDTNITINKDLSKVYDGKKVLFAMSDISVKGSTGAISYIWEMYNGSEWVKSNVPVNVGKYRVTVNVEEDELYGTGASTEEFEIQEIPIKKEVSDDSKNNKVETGDSNLIELWMSIGMLSLLVLGVSVVKRRSFDK